jgi:hypothetical protein
MSCPFPSAFVIQLSAIQMPFVTGPADPLSENVLLNYRQLNPLERIGDKVCNNSSGTAMDNLSK